MVSDKDIGHDEEQIEESPKRENAPRARNRTVMLTPDVTGEVRARFAGPKEQPTAALPDYTPAAQMAQQTPPPRPVVPQQAIRPASAAVAPQPVRVAAPQPHQPLRHSSGDEVVWVKPSPILGFLVSYDKDPNGQTFELRSGRLIITSEPAASGNFLQIQDDTVSAMHAIIRISAEGEIQVLDQLSEHGTKIRRFGSEEEQELSGDKSSLEHGDLISFGERNFHVCIVSR